MFDQYDRFKKYASVLYTIIFCKVVCAAKKIIFIYQARNSKAKCMQVQCFTWKDFMEKSFMDTRNPLVWIHKLDCVNEIKRLSQFLVLHHNYCLLSRIMKSSSGTKNEDEQRMVSERCNLAPTHSAPKPKGVCWGVMSQVYEYSEHHYKTDYQGIEISGNTRLCSQPGWKLNKISDESW